MKNHFSFYKNYKSYRKSPLYEIDKNRITHDRGYDKFKKEDRKKRLIFAMKNCDHSKLLKLISKGYDINYTEDCEDMPCFLIAASNKNYCLECFDILLKAGANINYQGSFLDNYGALHFLIYAFLHPSSNVENFRKSKEVINFLLNNGAKCNISSSLYKHNTDDFKQGTPLSLLIFNICCHNLYKKYSQSQLSEIYHVIQILFENGAKLYLKSITRYLLKDDYKYDFTLNRLFIKKIKKIRNLVKTNNLKEPEDS